MDPRPIRLILVARHPLLRRGIAQALDQEPSLEILDGVDGLRQALLLAQRVPPDVLLLDASACDGDAWVQVQAIRSRHPETAIVLLTGPDNDHVDPRLQTVAAATILRSVEPTALAAALESIVAGRGIDGVVSEAAGATALPQLTPRERQVLMSLSRGLTNREIARALWLSEHTVKFHVSSLYRKLGVRTRAEAATWLLESGISPAEPPHGRIGSQDAIEPTSRMMEDLSPDGRGRTRPLLRDADPGYLRPAIATPEKGAPCR